MSAHNSINALNEEKAKTATRVGSLEAEVKKLREELKAEEEKKMDGEGHVVEGTGGLKLTRLEVARVLRERDEYKEKYLSLLEQIRYEHGGRGDGWMGVGRGVGVCVWYGEGRWMEGWGGEMDGRMGRGEGWGGEMDGRMGRGDGWKDGEGRWMEGWGGEMDGRMGRGDGWKDGEGRWMEGWGVVVGGSIVGK